MRRGRPSGCSWRVLARDPRRRRPSAPVAPTAQDSAGAAPDVLRIGSAQDPKTLNPFVGVERGGGTRSGRSTGSCSSTSTPRTSTPAPGIAESWEVSEDQQDLSPSISIKDAKWSDGKPITSEDVKFSLEVLGDQRAVVHRIHQQRRKAIKTPDDETVVLEMKQP